ncbi:MAG: phosphatidylglycerol lysyltransferase domain-containing protein, partial [Firmicutes bacterium]|nr:phosphatidylglycerol lysyltransferase domain-containing protein [Bacillota bacterium]
MIFAVSFFQLPKLNHLLYNYIEINRFVQRLFSLLLLLIAWNLFGRKQLAWMLCVFLLSISLLMHFVFHNHFMNIPIIVCEIYALSVLLLCQSGFRRPSNKLSLKQAIFLAVLGLLTVLFNAVIGRANLSAHIGKPVSLGESLGNTIGILFGENSGFPAYEWFVFCFVWLCAAACVILVLRSAIIDKRITKVEKARAHGLVKKYGQNPTAYLTLEDDKHLYFGQEVDGVVAYGEVGGVVVVNGDPVCAPDDFVCLLAEFKAFCARHSYQCVFISVTELFIS